MAGRYCRPIARQQRHHVASRALHSAELTRAGKWNAAVGARNLFRRGVECSTGPQTSTVAPCSSRGPLFSDGVLDGMTQPKTPSPQTVRTSQRNKFRAPIAWIRLTKRRRKINLPQSGVFLHNIMVLSLGGRAEFEGVATLHALTLHGKKSGGSKLFLRDP